MNSTQLNAYPLSKSEFPRMWQILNGGVEDGVAPGFVAGLWQKAKPDAIGISAVGKRRLVPSGLPMSVETVFDLASVTKVFSTASLAAVLVDRGWLNWDTSVSAVFPRYPFQDIQIRHLLSHTAGFIAWQPLWEKLRKKFMTTPLYQVPIEDRQKAMRDLIFSISPEVPIETRAVYSDISFLLLGFLLEEVTGMPLDRAVKKLLWQPMGIQGAYYQRINQPVKMAMNDLVAATESCSWREGVLQGQVHDDNCWAMGGYGGHAGAFGAARDVLHFSKKLMEGFLTPMTLQAIWTRVSKPQGCDRTLGWDTPSGESPAASRKFSTKSVGHLGFTGTSLWIDPDAGLAVVLLSNRVHPSRENIKIRGFRPRFHEAIRIDLNQ